MKKYFLLPLSVCLFAIVSCSDEKTSDESSATTEETPIEEVQKLSYQVKNTLPHDATLFTEGLLFHKGKLFESTGSPNEVPSARSVIGVHDLETGKFIVKAEIDRAKYFGEGIVVFNDKLYQLTYTTQTGFIYDVNTFKQTGTFNYANREGWGMTTDGTNIIMSDGTENLTYLDPATLKPVKTVPVKQFGIALTMINELEFIKGFIYANVYLTNRIVKIDPANGNVVATLDMSSLTAEARNKNPQADVLNGIAYDPATDKIFVTGKFWKNLYEISFPH